jgi:hypothetical protein
MSVKGVKGFVEISSQDKGIKRARTQQQDGAALDDLPGREDKKRKKDSKRAKDRHGALKEGKKRKPRKSRAEKAETERLRKERRASKGKRVTAAATAAEAAAVLLLEIIPAHLNPSLRQKQRLVRSFAPSS